jgi:hypothetical protein
VHGPSDDAVQRDALSVVEVEVWIDRVSMMGLTVDTNGFDTGPSIAGDVLGSNNAADLPSNTPVDEHEEI